MEAGGYREEGGVAGKKRTDASASVADANAWKKIVASLAGADADAGKKIVPYWRDQLIPCSEGSELLKKRKEAIAAEELWELIEEDVSGQPLDLWLETQLAKAEAPGGKKKKVKVFKKKVPEALVKVMMRRPSLSSPTMRRRSSLHLCVF
uniref:Uncharacterized protein n=1 Tax=Leersia perrieri TaxID=77586 RepID=A0A0D9W493_9ORYZ